MINTLKTKKWLSSIGLISTPEHQRKSQAGSGLIEVMVSLLILGVGLLGVLSLQVNGINSSQRAVFVTDAQILAQDMADRILAFGNGTLGVPTNAYGAIDVSNAVSIAVPSCATGCNAAQTYDFDEAQWQSALQASSLPRGRGTVTQSASFYTVSVMWDQDRTGLGTVTCGTDNCFKLEVRAGP